MLATEMMPLNSRVATIPAKTLAALMMLPITAVFTLLIIDMPTRTITDSTEHRI